MRSRGTAVVAAVLFLALAALLGITVYSADDYWYSTFMDGGFGEFLELTREHYMTFNGRVLVHVVAQLILHFGTWFFAVVGTALCASLPCAAVLAAGRGRDRLGICAAVFAIGLLVMPHGMLVQGVLWISAFCNYVLPTAMLFGEILMLSRVTSRDSVSLRALPLCALCGLACGATTEQSGFVALAASLFFCLVCLIENRRTLAAPLLTAVCNALGLLTVFMSPATQSRFEQETRASGAAETLDALWHSFEDHAWVLGSSRIMAILLALLFICAAIVLRRATSRRAALAAALVPVPFALFIPFCPIARLPVLYAALFAALLLCALALILAKRRVQGLLILCAIAAVCVMLPTNTTGERVLLPFYLCMLGSASLLAGEAAELIKPVLRLGGLSLAAAAVLVLRIPTFGACLDNYRVERLNLDYAREARDTGVLYYCMDYNMEYTHTKAFNSDYFFEMYLKSAGLDPEETRVYAYGEGLPVAYLNGERLPSPAITGRDGEYLLPVDSIVEGLGGTVKRETDSRTLDLNGVTYRITYPDERTARIVWTTPSGTRSVTAERPEHYFCFSLPESTLTTLFPLTISESEGRVDLRG